MSDFDDEEIKHSRAMQLVERKAELAHEAQRDLIQQKALIESRKNDKSNALSKEILIEEQEFYPQKRHIDLQYNLAESQIELGIFAIKERYKRREALQQHIREQDLKIRELENEVILSAQRHKQELEKLRAETKSQKEILSHQAKLEAENKQHQEDEILSVIEKMDETLRTE